MEQSLSPSVILMNGASSSGKSTFGRYLQANLDLPYFYLSSDQLVEAGVLPAVDRTAPDRPRSWARIRPRFFDAFHRTVAGFADAGNPVIVEHVVEDRQWFFDLVRLLGPHPVLYVGVHCPVDELDRRERERGDRAPGEGRSHLADGIHTWGPYDVEIDTFRQTREENLARVRAALAAYRAEGSVFRNQGPEVQAVDRLPGPA